MTRKKTQGGTHNEGRYYLYLLLCADGSLYTGITTDVPRRFKEHKEGKGGHYTRAHGAERIIYTEKQDSRSHALKREALIKKMTREQKLALLP
jgi:putative endonuclease